MRFRKLRIAWSVVWGILAIVLGALWIQSYRSCSDFNPKGQIWLAWWYGGISIESRPSINPYFTQYYSKVPCWLSLMVAIAFVPLAWVPQRFALRTLMIAMTLAAMLLGLTLWAVRR